MKTSTNLLIYAAYFEERKKISNFFLDAEINVYLIIQFFRRFYSRDPAKFFTPQIMSPV
jgi:hypothetical protein